MKFYNETIIRFLTKMNIGNLFLTPFHPLPNVKDDSCILSRAAYQLTCATYQLTYDKIQLTRATYQLTRHKIQLSRATYQLTCDKIQLTRATYQLTRDKIQLTRDKIQLTRDKIQLTRDKYIYRLFTDVYARLQIKKALR